MSGNKPIRDEGGTTRWLSAPLLQAGLRHVHEQKNTECVHGLEPKGPKKRPFGRSACSSFQNSLSSLLRRREDGGESESCLHHSALPGPQEHPQSLGLTQSFSGGRGERLPIICPQTLVTPQSSQIQSFSLSPSDQKMTPSSDILVGNICSLASLSFPLLPFNFSFRSGLQSLP